MFLALGLLGIAPLAAAKPLKIGTVAWAGFSPLNVADTQGFWKAEGLTVEVNNTDAEGRLILGDALWYARQRGATHLVDVATLTGACVVALGKITTGLFGTPTPWVEAVQRAAATAGELVWPMPVFDDYKEQLKSEVADLLNAPGRPAGAITAVEVSLCAHA